MPKDAGKKNGAKRPKHATRSAAVPSDESDSTWGFGNRRILDEGTKGNEIENKDAEDNISDADETTEELTPDEEIAELKDKLLRTLADMENLRRRSQKDREDAVKFSAANFARDMLLVADNLRRASAASAQSRLHGGDVVDTWWIRGEYVVGTWW